MSQHERWLGTDKDSRFARMLDASPDGFVVVDAGGRIVYANARTCELFGYSCEELAGRTVDLLVPDEVREAHAGHRQRFDGAPAARPMGGDRILAARRRDGSTFAVEISLSPIDLGGERLVCATVRDVTGLQRAMRRARYEERQRITTELGSLLLCGGEVGEVLTAAARFVIEELGTPYVSILEVPPGTEELVILAEAGWQDSSIGQRRAWVDHSPLMRCVSGRTPIAREAWLDDPAITLTPRLAAHGVVGGITVPILGRRGVLGAVAAHHVARRAYTPMDTSFLQSVANVVGAAIEQNRTREAIFQSRNLEALGQLTGGVAHDFNNILTVVVGALQLLEDSVAGDPDAAENVQSALQAARRGGELSRKLLTFARRRLLAPRAFSVNDALADMLPLLRRSFGETYEIALRPDRSVPGVIADPAEFENVILNLCINARDAMPRGGRLTIETGSFDATEDSGMRPLKPGPYVSIAVTDTGGGMPPEVLRRAMEPFFTTKGSGKGTGLGLSMAHGYARQSGGDLTLYSQVGVGTTARLYLPATAVSGPAPADGGGEVRPSRRAVVLVVEDEPEVRRVAVRFLAALDFRVFEAGDAEEALRLLAQHPGIEVLFSDIGLPGTMNGNELSREARRRRPDLKVLLTSGYGFNATGQELDAPLLTKPYGRRELAEALRGIMEAD